MKKFLLLAVAGILASVTIASAANLEGQFSVSPVIGGYTYDTNQPRKSDANMIYDFSLIFFIKIKSLISSRE